MRRMATLARARNDHGGSVIAAHGINGNPDHASVISLLSGPRGVANLGENSGFRLAAQPELSPKCPVGRFQVFSRRSDGAFAGNRSRSARSSAGVRESMRPACADKDRSPGRELLGQRADVDAVAGEGLGAVRALRHRAAISPPRRNPARPSLESSGRNTASTRSSICDCDRIERDDAGLGDVGLDAAADLDAVALPARDQEFGAIAFDRQQPMRLGERRALAGVGLDDHRPALVRQPGDVDREGNWAVGFMCFMADLLQAAVWRRVLQPCLRISVCATGCAARCASPAMT